MLASIGFSPSRVGYSISFHPARPGFRGLTFIERRHIEIYIDDAMSDTHLRHVMAHEIGHAVDLVLLSKADENEWRAARNIGTNVPWWPEGYQSDFATPAGDYAECFAAALLGTPSRSMIGSCDGTAELALRLAQ